MAKAKADTKKAAKGAKAPPFAKGAAKGDLPFAAKAVKGAKGCPKKKGR